MKITEKCKVIVAGSLVAALMAGTALPALAASPAGDVPFAVLAQQNSAVTPEQVEALISQIGTVTRSRRAAIVAALDAYNQLDDAGKTAVTNFGVLAEAQQILGIQDALAKCNVNYDAVEDCWAITTPHDDNIDKRKTCGIGPNLYIWDKGNTIVFWEDFTYMGSSELDIDDIILRGGDYKYTYICDYDNSGYGYDKELGKWFAWATFEMEDSEVEWLRNLLSADTVIMRFEGTDYSKFDYTWTVQDRQAITDIIDLYNLLKAATPEEKQEIARAAFSCDWFLGSVNAMSEDGVFINIDGNANRVAAYAFGPKNVLLIVGMNKVVKTQEDAMSRARNEAAPVNAQRFGIDTPCSKAGSCFDCKSPECICCQILVTRFSRQKGRFKIILVDENLGF